MNAFEARIWVHDMTIKSLRDFAARLKPKDIADQAKIGDAKRAAHQMRKLADYLEKRRNRAVANAGLEPGKGDDDGRSDVPAAE